MSTDDLTRRARAEVLVLNAVPNGQAVYTQELLSELADEVDRLRAENAYLQHISDTYDEVMPLLGQTTIERDAARAALERVTDLLTLWARLASQQANLGDVVHDLTRALEGEP
ncbi:hypothetical protein [Oerskovia rustica]|uniref:Uncharacterized protein n=1 Tax=Oerskovia rustica TaxID=2762237 RepID=A0ABR8RP81_9CELL|nr:hypothetical protein [Oerskovia rustica]MBD7949607.1 hypothetical protein [Oerskovia rustica]